MKVKCIDAKNSFGLELGKEYDVQEMGYDSYRLTSSNSGMDLEIPLYHSKSRFQVIEPPRSIESITQRKEAGVDCSQEESTQIKAHLRRMFLAFPIELDEVWAEESWKK